MTRTPTLSPSTITDARVAISARIDELDERLRMISTSPIQTDPAAISTEAYLLERIASYRTALGDLTAFDLARREAIR